MKWTWDKFGFREPHAYASSSYSFQDVTEKLQALFRKHLPEEVLGTVWVVKASREPGYATLVALTTPVGDAQEPIVLPPETISGMRKEYGSETLRFVRWSDAPETLIRNALHSAEVDTVVLYGMIGRAIVLVQEDQVSRAIGPRGQNVRLASKLCGWDIEITTANQLELQTHRAKSDFRELKGVTAESAVSLVEQGYFSYDDLSVIDPKTLMQMGKFSAEQADAIIEMAETEAEHEQD